MKPPPLPNFHAFVTKYTGRVNRIVTPIAICQVFDPSQSQTDPTQILQSTALWDTGATASAVTPHTVKVLGLIPVRQAPIGHAGGSSISNFYVVNLILPNNVGMAGILVSECSGDAGDFGVVVGMDVISNGDLSITNAGGCTWVTFRFPSVQHIDYVAEAQKIKFSNVGRNDPCPCGKKDANGRPIKFKYCHGKNSTA